MLEYHDQPNGAQSLANDNEPQGEVANPAMDSIESDDIFQGGAPLQPREIAHFRSDNKPSQYYILRCDEHSKVFGGARDAMYGARANFRAGSHRHLPSNSASAIENFAIRVLKCDAVKSIINNDMAKTKANGGQPRDADPNQDGFADAAIDSGIPSDRTDYITTHPVECAVYVVPFKESEDEEYDPVGCHSASAG
jgi:hypothetical protein